MKLKINELESCLRLNQTLIDEVIRNAKINCGMENIKGYQDKLDKLNKQKGIIINEIEHRLDEMFSK